MRGEPVEAAGGNSAERGGPVERLIARRLRETAWGAAHPTAAPPPLEFVEQRDGATRRDDTDAAPAPARARRRIMRRPLAVLERAVRRPGRPGRGR